MDSAHGFSLFSGGERAGVCSARQHPCALALNEEALASVAEETGATQREKASSFKTYTVEYPFSLEFPKLIFSDTAHILTAPVRWDKREWVGFSLLAGAIATAAVADRSARSWELHNQNSVGYDIVDNLHQYSTYYSIGVLGLFYAGGAMFDNPKARAVAIDGASAALIALGIATGLEYVVGRARPGVERGAHYFTPFSSSNDSFPSAEATQAFAVASVIASHYDELWIKATSYGAASLVGLARTYHDQHWTSDVLAGALIGTAMGMAVVRYNEKRRSGKEKQTGFFVAPSIGRSAGGITVNLLW